ncbi:MAG: helix-turn-helix domain-containing protein [Planctomycetaceae bacterium]|jgi:hypothetical protein|nr:helix-turn-helix domain-containing protein [Planctomycetaceae bacterium]
MKIKLPPPALIRMPQHAAVKREMLERIGVNTAEAAEMLGTSINTIILLRKQGRLAHAQVGGRIIYSVAGLRRFVDNEKEKPGGYEDQPDQS